MDFQDILYAVDGATRGHHPEPGRKYRNALGYRMLDEIDQAFELGAPG